VSFRQQRPGLLCEGIVSKRLGSLYRSGRSPHWIKVKNPNAPAVKREAEEDWGEREMRPRKLSPKFISTALLLIAVFPQHRRKAVGTMAITVSNRGAITERPMVAVRNIAAAVGTSTVMVPPTVTQNKHRNRHHSRRRPVSGDGSGTSITGFALPPLLRHLIPAAKLPELLSR